MTKKQVTRGHNIVADGWAGVCNPQPHPNHTPKPPPTHSPTNKTNCSTLNTRFSRFQCERDISSVTDRQTNGPTDKASYRVVCPQFKTDQEIYTVLYLIHTFSIFKLKQFGHQKTENWKYAKIEQNMRILGQNARAGSLSCNKRGHNPLRPFPSNSTASF